MPDLIYFPQNKSEIEEYIETLLKSQLEKDYEAEKLLLNCIINVMFEKKISKFDISPKTVLFLLKSTSGLDEEGMSLLDQIFGAVSQTNITDDYIDTYWYLKDSNLIPLATVRLVNIFEFYHSLFPSPIISNDNRTFIYYPPTLKDTVYKIPEGVQNIGAQAFCGNKFIKKIVLPKTLIEIHKSAFLELSMLKYFEVEEGNPAFFVSDQGFLCKKNIKNFYSIVKCPAKNLIHRLTVRKDVMAIKSFAFEKCSLLEDIDFYSSNIRLEDSAFFCCPRLKSLNFKDGVGKFNTEAFVGSGPAVPENENNNENNFSENSAHTTPTSKNVNNSGFTMKNPSQIKKDFDDYIIGHESAKKTIAVTVYSHYIRCLNKQSNIGKSNVLICGPTGCGKTEFARTIARTMNVPFVNIDATSITETGMKGSNPTDMLKDLIIAANGDIEKAQKGIIYIDEIDKLATVGENEYREAYCKGVQQGLLKITEGGIIPIRNDNALGQPETINFDTTNVLFIVGGAFSAMTNKNMGEKKNSIGFGPVTKEETSGNNEKPLEARDFIKFGMTQEFMGRFPVIVQLKALTENDVYRIMLEPKNSVVTQYKNLVKCMGADLEFEPQLLHSIAKKAVDNGTGARGIRTVIENIVENVIFELPDKKNIKKVVVKGDNNYQYLK